MKKTTFIIKFEEGLHARPAMEFCQTAMKYHSNVQVIKNGDVYEAKSMLSVLCMGASKGDAIEIVVEGEDETEAMQAIAELLENEA